MHQLLRTILICVAFAGCGLVAFAQTEQAVDGFGLCLAGCCDEFCDAAGGDPDHSDDCKECHDSSLQVLADLPASGDSSWFSVAGIRPLRPERCVLPDDPFLDEIKPPLI